MNIKNCFCGESSVGPTLGSDTILEDLRIEQKLDTYSIEEEEENRKRKDLEKYEILIGNEWIDQMYVAANPIISSHDRMTHRNLA